jgi:hypothetical protein
MDWQRLIPRYWTQNEPTCLVWDKVLNKALDNFPIEYRGGHTCNIGPLQVWISNWPYAYGYNNRHRSGLPKVATRKRLRRMIGETQLRELEEAISKCAA